MKGLEPLSLRAVVMVKEACRDYKSAAMHVRSMYGRSVRLDSNQQIIMSKDRS